MFLGSQLHGSPGIGKNLSSIQQPMYSITPPDQASSNVSNIVHHAMIASKNPSQNSSTSAVQSSTAGRRSAFVQPLPSVSSLQNFTSGARLVTSSSFPKEAKSGQAATDESTKWKSAGGSEMSNSFPF